ncbi:MAG: hypothetical protein CO093_06325 [Alphaproteobacteria bacterium CG_4_9_14_3_um_filter_47_13]|nr:MAG: hypothetical protein CO093_06325 [Alphaproteobacteria bacterium CG_4_9_14_3_um_filter_47_13]
MADELIHEIKDAIAQDRLERFWKEYGSYIIAAAVLTIMLTALLTGWRSWNTKINITQTDAIIEALDDTDKTAALESIKDDMRPGRRVIAELTAAGLLLEADQKEDALQHYQTVAADRKVDPVFRDLALLMAVRLEGDREQSTPADARNLLEKLQPLWSDSSNPWQYQAHLQAAMILAHDFKDYAQARDHLAVIMTAETVPPTLTQRAQALDHVYNLKMAASSLPNDDTTKEDSKE